MALAAEINTENEDYRQVAEIANRWGKLIVRDFAVDNGSATEQAWLPAFYGTDMVLTAFEDADHIKEQRRLDRRVLALTVQTMSTIAPAPPEVGLLDETATKGSHFLKDSDLILASLSQHNAFSKLRRRPVDPSRLAGSVYALGKTYRPKPLQLSTMS
jgi:hypothetical protein